MKVNLKQRVNMYKKVLVWSLLFLFTCNNLFANEKFSKEQIEKMISKMVVLGFSGETVNPNDEIYKNIKAGLGGVILFDKDPNDKQKVKNVRNKEQLNRLTSSLQAISKQKLLISIDQEGGIVQRLKSSDGFVNTPKASEVALKGESFAKQSYALLAKDLKESGINTDFAPVVDLAINKENKVIVTRGRSFGESSKDVIKYSSIFVDELKKQKIISVLKHFPGHGSSLGDSHLGFVDISTTWSPKELEPYKYFIQNNKIEIETFLYIFTLSFKLTLIFFF